MAYGLTDTGFVVKPLSVIKEELETEYKSAFGEGLNVQAEAPAGQMIGIHSEREYKLWLLAQSVHTQNQARAATGTSLDNILAFSNTKRLKARKSIVTERLYGTPGTLVGSGTIISISGAPTIKFATDENATIAAAVNEKQTLTFNEVPTAGTYTITFKGQTTSALAYNANNAAIQAALELLSTIGAGNVSVTGDYASGIIIEFISALAAVAQDQVTAASSLTGALGAVTISIAETIEGGSYVDVGCSCTVTGVIPAYAGTLTVIDTPVSGLTSVTNKLDAEPGRAVESDAEAKIRREQNLIQTRSATLDGIIAAVSEVDGVTKVAGFENNGDDPDIDGRPGHSIEIVVKDGSDADIAQAIWDSKAGGIEYVGLTTATTIDSQGITRTIKFNRPVDINMWVIVDILKETGQTVLEADVKAAILAYGNALNMGDDVLPNSEILPYMTDAESDYYVPYIRDISIKVGTVNPPTVSTPITIDINEIAKFDSTRITVNII